MSQVRCPICGKYTPDSSFLKPRPINDIGGVYMRGLGRGRGFEVTDRFSLRDDKHLTGVIADRCRQTLNLINEPSNPSYDSVLKNRDEWVRYANTLMAQNDDLMRQVKDLEESEAYAEEMEYLLEKINKEIDYDFEFLEDGINYLLELLFTHL